MLVQYTITLPFSALMSIQLYCIAFLAPGWCFLQILLGLLQESSAILDQMLFKLNWCHHPTLMTMHAAVLNFRNHIINYFIHRYLHQKPSVPVSILASISFLAALQAKDIRFIAWYQALSTQRKWATLSIGSLVKKVQRSVCYKIRAAGTGKDGFKLFTNAALFIVLNILIR